jgi:hypothetical protein
MFIVLILFLLMPSAQAVQLTGGTDYNEYILDSENGKEDHGTKVIDWNHWVDRLLNKAFHVMGTSGDFPAGSICHFNLLVDNERRVSFSLISTNNLAFAYSVDATFEALNGSKYLEFPKGTQRSEFQLTNLSCTHTFAPFWRSHANGYLETQNY